MSAKSILRTRYRNGFRVNQELGMPLSFVLRIKSHADGVALRCFRQFPRTKLVVVGASFRQLIVAILFASILRYTFISICKQERSLPCGYPRDNG